MSIRILCLHGRGQNANILQSQLRSLGDRLSNKHNVELAFIDSPISNWNIDETKTNSSDSSISKTDSDRSNNIKIDTTEKKKSHVSLNSNSPVETLKETIDDIEVEKQMNFKWFEDFPTRYSYSFSESLPSNCASSCHNNEVTGNETHSFQYTGMDASLLHVLQIWQHELYSRPFHGILAFHQGTVLTNILLLSKKLKNCEFVIFASGYLLNDPPPGRGCMGVPQELFMDPPTLIDVVDTSSRSVNPVPLKSLQSNHKNIDDNQIQNYFIGTKNMKSLHLIGRKNKQVNPEKSRKLAQRFYSAQVYEHCNTDDYRFPNRPRDFNVIGKFIIKCKNEILNRSNASLIQSTQSELAFVTQEASDLIRSTINSMCISNNPPKALMAVIAPKTMGMGGWIGPKLSDPTDGGGAPCPPEFLKRKGERIRENQT